MSQNCFGCKRGLDGFSRPYMLYILAWRPTFLLQDAQTNTTTGPAVPGWGIALLVLMSIFLAGILFCVCCAPFCCKTNGIEAQDGLSSAMNRLKCWE
ncbi:hypothetical protein GDO81_003231 [Engystomops pustulosus]|uniref:Uncharacterized protein n=1 Tax=Engystomops pustulosus TaxID=76066 RepID=A0AAV6ZVB0_ENGPU|nr:hypothetical protein GDO81_003231 [Engystomops pustulosus]